MTPGTMQSLIILFGFIIFGVGGFGAKLLIDRYRYAKEVVGKVQYKLIHKVGFPDFGLAKIENIGGMACIKDPRFKHSDEPPIHALAECGVYPWYYPINKSAWVRATVPTVEFYENDAEPLLSSVSSMPVISARMIGSFVQAISLATSSAMQKSNAESTESAPSSNVKMSLKWVYVGLVAVGAIGIIGIIFDSQIRTALAQLGIALLNHINSGVK